MEFCVVRREFGLARKCVVVVVDVDRRHFVYHLVHVDREIIKFGLRIGTFFLLFLVLVGVEIYFNFLYFKIIISRNTGN